jgi:hypothetical protein
MPADRLLREHQDAIDDHVEDAAGRLDQRDRRVGIDLRELGDQTGRPGLVVSDDAVGDRDLHREHSAV